MGQGRFGEKAHKRPIAIEQEKEKTASAAQKNHESRGWVVGTGMRKTRSYQKEAT